MWGSCVLQCVSSIRLCSLEGSTWWLAVPAARQQCCPLAQGSCECGMGMPQLVINRAHAMIAYPIPKGEMLFVLAAVRAVHRVAQQ